MASIWAIRRDSHVGVFDDAADWAPSPSTHLVDVDHNGILDVVIMHEREGLVVIAGFNCLIDFYGFAWFRNPNLDPLNPDTDGDGMWDGAEILNGRDPLTYDPVQQVPALSPFTTTMLVLSMIAVSRKL